MLIINAYLQLIIKLICFIEKTNIHKTYLNFDSFNLTLNTMKTTILCLLCVKIDFCLI